MAPEASEGSEVCPTLIAHQRILTVHVLTRSAKSIPRWLSLTPSPQVVQLRRYRSKSPTHGVGANILVRTINPFYPLLLIIPEGLMNDSSFEWADALSSM
ncbi:hypothetical protein ASPCADRAFT_207432, partial [Aspergillus carbonarius ITEM 5010]